MEGDFEALCAQLRGTLLARRSRISEQLARHPRPVAGCDVEFNRLLEERALLAAELDRFDAFIASSPLLSAEAKDHILQNAIAA